MIFFRKVRIYIIEQPAVIWIAIFLIGCTAEQKSYDNVLYRNLNGSGHLFLKHYTSLIPTLGPCGFSRNSDDYNITLPAIQGKIDCPQLKVYLETYDTHIINYYGYIEFLDSNRVFVHMFKQIRDKQVPLSINGKHTIKVLDNKIANKRI